MDHQRVIIYSILRYLDEQIAILPDEQAESIEVAKSCLEAVYGDVQDPHLPANYQSLSQLFQAADPAGVHSQTPPVTAVLTEAQKASAEASKGEGNELMKREKFTEALVCYTKAIDIDPSNAVYYCNRAAAYSKLGQHTHALNDCTTALEIDPHYSKAYGRKGLAHSAMQQHGAARDCYQRAMDLDPSNASYKQNLDIAQQRLAEMPPPSGGSGTGTGTSPMAGFNMGGLDFSSMLSNPALMNMATNMLQDPHMQEMMSNMMSGGGGQPGGSEGLSSLLQAGQQLAQQMQESNPDLVNELRNQMQRDPNEPSPPPDSQ